MENKLEQVFRQTRRSREIFLEILEKFTPEQLVHIPQNMSNNIFWNIAHIMVSQQRLAYSLSGLPMIINEDLYHKYKNGTQGYPEMIKDELQYVKDYLIQLIDQTENDYKNGKFINFKPYKTMTGFDLNTFEDAMNFSWFHEGIHLGFIMKIKRFV